MQEFIAYLLDPATFLYIYNTLSVTLLACHVSSGSHNRNVFLSRLIFGGVKDNGVMETCNFILTAVIYKEPLVSSLSLIRETTLEPIKEGMKCN